MKKYLSLSIIIAMVVSMMGFNPMFVQSSGDVTFAQAFPDANFRNYILTEIFDGNRAEDDAISEDDKIVLASQTFLSFTWVDNISDLTGLAYFTGLEILRCNDIGLTELDISQNTVLKELFCAYNQLTSLDVSRNVALESIYCYDNQLTSLDISNNPSLKMLWVANNNMGSDPFTSIPGWRNFFDMAAFVPAGGVPLTPAAFWYYPQNNPSPIPFVYQFGTLTAGTGGTVVFSVATADTRFASYDVIVSNLPTGVTVQGRLNIFTAGGGSLTLIGDTSTVAGTYDNLTLTINGVTSAPFTLTINSPTPHYGDVNGDGVINSADVTMLKYYIASSDRPKFRADNPTFNFENARVAGGTDVTAADVSLLQLWIATPVNERGSVKLGP